MEYLDVQGVKVTAPSQLPQALAGSEGFLERYTRHKWWPMPAARTEPAVQQVYRVRPRVPARWEIDDITEETEVLLAGTALLPGSYGYELDYYKVGEPACVLRLANVPNLYTLFGSTLDLAITGWWGWYPPPPEIVDGVYRLAARLYQERKAAYSDTVLLPDSGIMTYFRQLPASVQAGVGAYMRPRVGSIRLSSA